MQEDEFLSAVQRRTQVESTDEAYTIVRATLDVLGQRITEGEADDIASQLPTALDTALTSAGDAEEFSAAEFVERVHAREVEDGEFTDPDTGFVSLLRLTDWNIARSCPRIQKPASASVSFSYASSVPA